MKQLLVIAVALTAINAQASRARVAALGNAPHLVDTALVYDQPAYIFSLGDYVMLESGNNPGLTAGAQNGNAEGMIVRSHGDAKWGLSLGHQSLNASAWAGGLRSAATTAALKVNQQNPIEFTYGAKSGEWNWAGTLVYSNYNDKQAGAGVIEKESSAGVRFGIDNGKTNAALRLGLTNTVQDQAANKLTGTLGLGLDVRHQMDAWLWTFNYSNAGFKEENAAGTEIGKVSTNSYAVGVNTAVKKDGNEFFYGASLRQTEMKNDTATTKQTTMGLPVWIGLEAEANSWLTFRGSISQTTMIHSSKTELAGTTVAETAPGANTTTVALGTGMKFGKVTVDGTLSTATTQTVNTTNLMGMVGVGYWF